MARVWMVLLWGMALFCAFAQEAVAVSVQAEPVSWPGGSVAEVQAVEVFGEDAPAAWAGWLSNGVRAHTMPMSTEQGRAVLRVMMVDAQQPDLPGAGEAAVALLAEMHQAESPAGKALAASGWRLWAQSGRRGLVINLEGHSETLPQAIQALAMGLEDPQWAAGGFSRWRERTRAAMEANGTDLAHALNLAIDEAMGLPAPARPVLDGDEPLTESAVQQWLRQAARTRGMAVAVVGDVDRARTMELLGEWFGGLAQRPRVVPVLPSPWTIRETSREIQIDGHSSVVVFRGVVGPLTERLDEVRALRQSIMVLDQRLGAALREAGLDAQSARSGMLFGDQHSGRCLLWLTGTVAPDQAERAMGIFNSVLADLASHPPTEAEFASLSKTTDSILDRQLASPAYWADRLVSADTTGVPLLSARGLRDAYDQISAEAISRVLGEHLLDQHRIDLKVGQIEVVPEQ